jgi:hypothetical protein
VFLFRAPKEKARRSGTILDGHEAIGNFVVFFVFHLIQFLHRSGVGAIRVYSFVRVLLGDVVVYQSHNFLPSFSFVSLS